MPQFSVEGGPEENCAARLYAGASVRFTDVGGLGTSVAKDWVGLVRLLQGFDFGFEEADVKGFDGEIQVRHLAGSDNGCGDPGLCQHPSQRNLRILNSPVPGDLAEPFHHFEI